MVYLRPFVVKFKTYIQSTNFCSFLDVSICVEVTDAVLEVGIT